MITGPIQGSVVHIQKASLDDKKKKKALSTFVDYYKKYAVSMKSNPESTKAELAIYYNVPASVASDIYDNLWTDDGLDTTLCFNSTRLGNVEGIFAADTGISVPTKRTWITDFGCKKKTGKEKNRVKSLSSWEWQSRRAHVIIALA